MPVFMPILYTIFSYYPLEHTVQTGQETAQTEQPTVPAGQSNPANIPLSSKSVKSVLILTYFF